MDSSITIGFRQPTATLETEDARRIRISRSPDESCGSDESLIARIQLNDHDAMLQLFRRHAGGIRRVGRRILRDNGEADDLVQEVFLYIHRKSTLVRYLQGLRAFMDFSGCLYAGFNARRQLKSHGFYVSVITDGPTENEAVWRRKAYMYELTVEGLFR